ncbi:MAG: hypothetical protein GC155_10865 [Alphaproteobacteria bacterium]|nr:hypothetical protein [Alphaproteobacteria bacterium]
MVRIIQLVIGAVLAGAGAYLTWLNRAHAPQLFPPDPHNAPWILVAGLGALVVGLVALVGAAIPGRGRKLRLAEEAARREAALQAADAYYAERARAADRDWRSGDLPPGPVVHAPPPVPPEPAPEPVAPEPEPPRAVHRDPAPPQPEPPEPAVAETPRPPAPEKAPPLPEPVVAAAAPRGFPSAATLAPIPKSVSEPVPPVTTAAPSPAAEPVARQPAASMAAVAAAPAPSPTEAAPDGAFGAIRAAISANELDEADRALNEERARLTAAGAGSEIALAELTGLAGDHAAAAGRTGAAKWLWRLALQRFGSANAINSPAARAVSERLRLADQ